MKYERKCQKASAKIVTPIGIPVYDPAIPTSGALREPSTNGNNPNNAEALPAICPCDSIANVKMLYR